MKMRIFQKKNINISLAFNCWYDVTNDKAIGDAKELIEYVNTNRLTVKNETAFLENCQFWYNKN